MNKPQLLISSDFFFLGSINFSLYPEQKRQKKLEIIEKIKDSVNSIVSLSDEEIITFCSAFTSKKLKKDDFFLKEGQVCDFVGFVGAGILV